MRPWRRKTALFGHSIGLRASHGFTFIEAIIVVAVLAILSAMVTPKSFNISSPTLPAQARTLAADLQRAQWLAANSGSTVFICVFSDAYVVQHGSYAVGQDCPSSAPVQSSDSQPIVAALDNAVTLNATAGTLSYDSLGQASTAISYTLTGDSDTQTVGVTATSGMVTWGSP